MDEMMRANPAPIAEALPTGRPVSAEAPAASVRGHRCLHCGEPVLDDRARETGAAAGTARFCCTGCAAAFATIRGLGLDGYYRRRVIDPRQRPTRPDEEPPAIEYAAYSRDEADGSRSLSLMIEGIHCGACVWLIESVLSRATGVVSARVNMTTRRLALVWDPAKTDADTVVGAVTRLGYGLVPYDPALIGRASVRREQQLLRALAVAGFATGNVMLLSVAVWAGHFQGMGPATRDLLHWVSALIALPAIAYAVRPFFRSAVTAVRAGGVNMDVPITLAVILAGGMSLHQTIIGAQHAYFDSAVALLFFLLIGRYLDLRARGKARSAAEHLMTLGATAVSVIDPSGKRRLIPPAQVVPGMAAFVVAGERIGIDGVVRAGTSDIDTGLINGETVPTGVQPGSPVFAGTLNLSGSLTIEVTAVGEDTLLAEIARLMETAEQGRGRYVALADRIARYYGPVVHTLAAATFAGWWLIGGIPWQGALLNAIAVLIITCPCALALAVPAVQVIASGRLLRQGILIKSATALERLASADVVAFDKTGTLTEGRPEFVAAASVDPALLREAGGLAAASKHPLARALVQAAIAAGHETGTVAGVREVPGSGLEMTTEDGPVRLGSRAFCGVANETGRPDAEGPEMWFARPGMPPVRFAFRDRLRADAAAVVAGVRARGLDVVLLSGDRSGAVAAVAAAVGIGDWHAACQPAAKCGLLKVHADQGRRVLMVGDGLNDAPALAAAHVSISPASAVDLSQTAADFVFQGARLEPVLEAIDVARRAMRLIKENFALTFFYNVLTIPLAVAGFVIPLVAAIAMSASSLIVILNALRLNRSMTRGLTGGLNGGRRT
jgi:P-type Cu2+ transporter